MAMPAGSASRVLALLVFGCVTLIGVNLMTFGRVPNTAKSNAGFVHYSWGGGDGYLPEGNPNDETLEGNRTSFIIWHDHPTSNQFKVTLSPSRWRGVCTNWGRNTEPDYKFLIGLPNHNDPNVWEQLSNLSIRTWQSYGSQQQVTVVVSSFDHGGYTNVTIDAGDAGIKVFAIPKDTDGDYLPDAWETANWFFSEPTRTFVQFDPDHPDTDGNGVLDFEEDFDAPIDSSIPGTDAGYGDGFEAHAEYRGFAILGGLGGAARVIARTNELGLEGGRYYFGPTTGPGYRNIFVFTYPNAALTLTSSFYDARKNNGWMTELGAAVGVVDGFSIPDAVYAYNPAIPDPRFRRNGPIDMNEFRQYLDPGFPYQNYYQVEFVTKDDLPEDFQDSLAMTRGVGANLYTNQEMITFGGGLDGGHYPSSFQSVINRTAFKERIGIADDNYKELWWAGLHEFGHKCLNVRKDLYVHTTLRRVYTTLELPITEQSREQARVVQVTINGEQRWVIEWLVPCVVSGGQIYPAETLDTDAGVPGPYQDQGPDGELILVSTNVVLVPPSQGQFTINNKLYQVCRLQWILVGEYATPNSQKRRDLWYYMENVITTRYTASFMDSYTAPFDSNKWRFKPENKVRIDVQRLRDLYFPGQ